ncbi:helix-turn-helix transcriptional regulator [Paenibacillus elgii]|uniref:helix-turn-helix transcriptional regulator n=1 Tax=Paenibacillus elgii TaxID=189691 RepID=UPI000248D922|nr:YafY family protein [Paenibacillus elgii]
MNTNRHQIGSKGRLHCMKLDRLLAITMLLLNRNRVSAKELSERFEVSLRTVYRDIEAINQAGIPIVSYAGQTGGYEITDRYRLDRQLLSFDELQSLIVALRGMQTTLDDRHFGSLLDKVGALLVKSEQGSVTDASKQIIIDMNPWRNGTADKEKLETLRKAIRENRLTAFEYTNGKGEQAERLCEPMSVVLKGYVWYMYGYCRLREDFRIFRLSRMRNLQAGTETFERRELPADQLDSRWTRRETRHSVNLVLQFTSKVRVPVEDYYKPEQIEYGPDGTLVVRASHPDAHWTYAHLLSYGADVKVLEPEAVASRLREEALAIARLYEQP